MNDQELFDFLKQSEVGTHLADYLDRFVATLCDVRNITPGTDLNAVLGVVRKIEEDIIEKIRLSNPKDDTDPSPYL